MFVRCVSALAAVFLCAAVLIVPQCAGREPLFPAGETYVFYTASASSNARIVVTAGEDAAKTKRRLFCLTGESTAYADARAAFDEAARYGAELVFSERAGEVCNYYYYAPGLAGAVYLGGHAVNLHIAVRGGGAAVGSPLIFGGY